MNISTLESLGIQKDDRVLEIGFGGGALLNWIIARKPSFAAGVEISHLALDKAKRRLANEVASGTLRLAAIKDERIPFSSATFSKACCVNVIYFWDDLVAMMSEVHRVLRRGGKFVLCYQETGPNNSKTPPLRIVRSLTEAGFDVLTTRRAQDRYNGEYFCTTAQKL